MDAFSIQAKKYVCVCLAALVATTVSFVLMTALIRFEISQQPFIKIVHINATQMTAIRKKPLPQIREKAEKILPTEMPSSQVGKIYFPETQTRIKSMYPELGTVAGLVDSQLIAPLIAPPIKSLIPMNIVRPHYPFRASIREIEGFVVIAFTVRENGTVQNPFVIDSEPGKLFDEAALSAISKFKFYPQEISGEPTLVEDVRIKFSFKLNSPYVEHQVEFAAGKNG